jgi:hypothetical protein
MPWQDQSIFCLQVLTLTFVLRKNSPHMVSGNTWCVTLEGMRLKSFAHSTSIPTTGSRENTYTTLPYDLRPDSTEHNFYSRQR